RGIDMPISWHEIILSTLCFYWSSTILSVPVLFVTSRYVHIDWWKQGLLHLFTASAFIAVHPVVTVALIDWAPDTRPPFIDFMYAEMMSNLIMYVGIAGYAFIVSYNAEVQNRKVEESSLRTELAQAHAQMLRVQIRPDFLFHTFHEIS